MPGGDNSAGGNSGKLHGGWQTAGVVFVSFVANAFGQWLVEQLADAGRKKLTELVLGSEQERALQQAATAAIQATARQCRPKPAAADDPQSADHLARVINKVFQQTPAPAESLAEYPTLLEGLEAGVAGQLTVLDNTELTGIGQSSADLLGVQGAVLADRLTGHLVREIIVRGSGGGALTPLASQLNHERTREMIARLPGEIRDALAWPDRSVTVAGRLLAEVTDPFDLEVHRPVQPEDAPPGLPLLPPYVPREHDEVLGQVVRAAAGGRSGIVVLVGGSSVGKTRAGWEALALLRDQDVAAVASDRPVPRGRGAAGAGRHRTTDGGMAERGPVLPRRRGRAGRAGRRRAAGAAARPRPGPGAGTGHAVARILGRPGQPPGRRR